MSPERGRARGASRWPGAEHAAAAGAWLDRFFESYYRLRPVNATFTGLHEYDHLLPDWSPMGLEALIAGMRTLRDQIPNLDPSARGRLPSPLSGPPALDVLLADGFLEIQLAELDGRQFVRGNPSLWAGEAVFAIIALMTHDFAPLERRVESAAARMRAIPKFLGDAPATLAGATLPNAWRGRALRECEGARRLFDGGIARWLRQGVAPPLERDTVDAARVALAAFDSFAEWLRASPSPEGDASVACGPEMFDLFLGRGHWCSVPRKDLLTEARARIEDESALLDRMAATVAPGGWPEIRARLAERHPTADEYLLAFQRTWDACRELSVAHRLVAWPDIPVRFVPIPPWTREAAPFLYYLFYRSPAPLETLDVHEALVTPIDASMAAEVQETLLRANNDSVIKLNHVVHHGALGHHVQNYYAARATSRIGRVAAVDCASRIGMFCGGTMAEGWACYATGVMEELGFLTDLERVSEQHTQVRMLARAVVDISLHEGTMSLDDATAFYVERGLMPPDAARNEAVKNSMFPGAAVMYWVGTQGIRDLRDRVAAARGAGFSLRRFHDELLSYGSLPVPLIARQMESRL